MLLEDLVEKNLLGTVPKVSFVRTYSGLLPCEHPIPCIQLQPLNLLLAWLHYQRDSLAHRGLIRGVGAPISEGSRPVDGSCSRRIMSL